MLRAIDREAQMHDDNQTQFFGMEDREARETTEQYSEPLIADEPSEDEKERKTVRHAHKPHRHKP